MKTVSIPSDIFSIRVRREYSSPLRALMREFLQNSCDAGAKRIDFTYDAPSRALTIADNGRGIVPELVEVALFTLGGSFKSEASIGGMGAAKELCFFAHPRYEIHTHTTKVIGFGPQYEITPCETHYPGFLARITFPDDWYVSEDVLRESLRWVTSHSSLSAEIAFCGQVMPASFVGRKSPISNPLGKILTAAPLNGEEANDVFVRANGLLMFSWRVGLPMRRHVILEIERPSIEVLTQNRDGFRDEHATTFSQLIDEITTQRASFGGAAVRSFEIPPGESAWRRGPDVTAPVESVLSDVLVAIPRAVSVLDQPGYSPSQNSVEGSSNPAPERYGASKFSSRFHIDLADSAYASIPKWYHPALMSGETLWLIKAWRWALELVRTANNVTHSYELGITLNSEHAAEFRRTKGMPVYLINPECAGVKSRDHRKLVCWLIQIAAHELTHHRFSYHSEEFISNKEEAAAAAFDARPPIGACLRAIAKVRL